LIKKFFKRDNLWLGIAIGIALPLSAYYLFEGLNVYSSRQLLDKPVIFSKSTSQLIALFMNVLIFRVYMLRWEMDRTGRGILLATFVYALVFFYMNRSYLF
jgi:hypothetical protein